MAWSKKVATDESATVLLDNELNVLELGKSVADLFGLVAKEVKGTALGQLLQGDTGDIPWEKHLSQARIGLAWRGVLAQRARGGVRLWVSARLEACETGARLICHPATVPEILGVNAAPVWPALQVAFAAGGVGVFLHDMLSQRQVWSERMCELYGLPPGTPASHQGIFDSLHPEDQPRLARAIQVCIAEGTPLDIECRLKNTSGEYREVKLFAAVAQDAEGVQLFNLGGALDVSRERALERRVAELELELQAAQRNDVVGRLAGGIAHDFNNLLTVILASAHFATEESLSDTQREELSHVKEAAERATELTRQLLAFGARQALREVVVEFDESLGRALRLLRRVTPENIQIHVDWKTAGNCVLVDETQLHQVLSNLVVNASHALPNGGAIWLSSRPASESFISGLEMLQLGYLRLSVEDNGPGIRPEKRQQVFEPFYTSKPVGQGTGLGLSVVQGIVKQHRGRVTVTKSEQGGAAFHVLLPVAEPEAKPQGVSRPSSIELSRTGVVLLVEDEPMVRELSSRILTAHGFEVMSCQDGLEALKVAGSLRFDVLVTDVVMPHVGGPELVTTLLGRGLEFAVVYLSGYPRDFVETRVSLGAEGCLVHKPFTPSKLVEAVEQQLLACRGTKAREQVQLRASRD